MKHVIVLLLIATFISCQKDSEKPTLPEKPGTVAVRLQLQGDFLTSEGPLPYGRQAGGMYSYAKTLRDSTIYAVMVYQQGNWNPFSSGLFNQRDSIILMLPEEGIARISAYAINKGSSEGLYYEMRSGVQYFDYPLNAEMTNQMDSLHRRYDQNMMWDTLSSLQVIDPANQLQAFPRSHMPEVDAHYGVIDISATAPPRVVNLPMKRAAFGVQLVVDKFTTGKLLMEFPGVNHREILPQDMMQDGFSKIFIYSEDIFKHQDFYRGSGLAINLKWVKTSGDIVALGQKNVSVKRNVLTRLKVTLPTTGRSSAPTGIIETHFPLPR